MNEPSLSLPTMPSVRLTGDRTEEHYGRTRANVTLDIDVEGSLANGQAILHDLSNTGAAFVTKQALAVPGAMIVLRIPAPNDVIEILARVQRVEELADGGQFMVVRFAQVDPDADDALSSMLACLLAVTRESPDPGSLAPRRLKLKLGGERSAALLAEIARGSLSMTLPRPMVHDAWLHIEVPGPTGQPALALAARVVSQRLVGQNGIPAFQILFAFERMRASDRAALTALQQRYA